MQALAALEGQLDNFDTPFAASAEIIRLAGELTRQREQHDHEKIPLVSREYLRMAGLLRHRLTLFASITEMHAAVFGELAARQVPLAKLSTYIDDLATWVHGLDHLMDHPSGGAPPAAAHHADSLSEAPIGIGGAE